MESGVEMDDNSPLPTFPGRRRFSEQIQSRRQSMSGSGGPMNRLLGTPVLQSLVARARRASTTTNGQWGRQLSKVTEEGPSSTTDVSETSEPDPSPSLQLFGRQHEREKPYIRRKSVMWDTGGIMERMEKGDITESEEDDIQQQEIIIDAKFGERLTYRYMMAKMYGGLYLLTIVIVGTVFATQGAAQIHTNIDPLYERIFELLLYVTSICALLYLSCYIPRQKQDNNAEPSAITINIVEIFKNTHHNVSKANNHLQTETETRHNNNRDSNDSLHKASPAADATDSTTESADENAAINFQASGVSLFLRLGAIGFGVCSVIYDLIRIAGAMGSHDGVTQPSPFYFIDISLHVVFISMQTFFVYKLHKMVINVQRMLVRLCLLHLLAANVCVWFRATLYEIHEDFHVSTPSHPPAVNDASSDNHLHSNTTTSTRSGEEFVDYSENHATSVHIEGASALDKHSSHGSGTLHMTLIYLFPCIVEYSLIAVAILYHILLNVGHCEMVGGQMSKATDDKINKRRLSEDPSTQSTSTSRCHKSNRGLFGGLGVLIVCLVTVLCYLTGQLVVVNTEHVVVFGVKTSALVLSSVCIIITFLQFRRFRFVSDDSHQLDIYLLVVALTGVVTLQVFHLWMAFNYIANEGHYVDAELRIIKSFVELVQSFLQSLLIVEGKHRRCKTTDQLRQKPARSLVVFVMISCLSLWIMNVFFIRYDEQHVLELTTGNTLTSSLQNLLLSRVCLPLIMFFRFHSTVCLYEVWTDTYKLD